MYSVVIKVKCEISKFGNSKEVVVYQFDNRKEFVLRNWHDMVMDKMSSHRDITREEFLAFSSYYLVSHLRMKEEQETIARKFEGFFCRKNVKDNICEGLSALKFEVIADQSPKMVVNLDCRQIIETS